MGMKWTEEQSKVITLRDRNILVSAAAGSGKTAVLVQRILSRIMDPDRPVDIDRLLIMTFTSIIGCLLNILQRFFCASCHGTLTVHMICVITVTSGKISHTSSHLFQHISLNLSSLYSYHSSPNKASKLL